jgi:hypothetical protein
MNAPAQIELRKQLRKTCQHHAQSGEPYAEMIPLIDESFSARWPTVRLSEIETLRSEVEDELISEGLLHI